MGKRLSESLRLPFVDLDREIEVKEGTTISDLLTRKGESYFRTVESTLLKLKAASQEDFVMATGGGAPCFHDGMKIINENGLSVYLDVPLPTLFNRTNSSGRPLLESDDRQARLRSLFERRASIYQQAHLTYNEEAGDTFEVLVADLIKKLSHT